LSDAVGARRRVLLLSGLAAFALSAYGADSESVRLDRVVFVGPGDTIVEEERAKVIADFASEGLLMGRHITIEWAEGIGFGDPWPPEAERRAREIVATHPAVILAPGNKIHIFRKVTKEIPLVFFYLGRDPVEWGLVETYGHPGGNITGAGFPLGEDTFKVIELLKEFRPEARRIGTVLWSDEIDPTSLLYSKWRRSAATKLGLEYVEIVLAPSGSFASLIPSAIRRARLDLYLGGTLPEVREFLVRAHIPFTGDAHKGGLCSVYASWDENLQSAISIASQVLRGAKPADIPVRFPSKYDTIINLRTAREMGLAIPSSALIRATVVIDESGKERR